MKFNGETGEILSKNGVVVAKINNTTDRLEIVRGVKEIISVQHRVATNTAGGATVVGLQDRPINFLVENAISGAAFNTSTGVITLPAGKYRATGYSDFYAVNTFQTFIATVSAPGVAIATGSTGQAYASTGASTVRSQIDDVFTLSSATDVKMRAYTQTARSGDAFGTAVNSGIDNVHAALTIEKIG